MSTPFKCKPVGYQLAGNAVSTLYEINLVTGVETIIADQKLFMNALGYNTTDNFLYARSGTDNTIYRIDSIGEKTPLPVVSNLPDDSYNIGTFDSDGHYYLYKSNIELYYCIDYKLGSINYGQLVDPTNNFNPTKTGTSIKPPINIADFAYCPIDSMLYAVINGSTTPTDSVVRIDPKTGVVTNLKTTSVPSGTYGATFADSTNNIFVIDNNTGIIYKIAISGNDAIGVVFAQGVPSSNNDGASCVNISINLDYGDAPDNSPENGIGNYNTLLANNGPRHQLLANGLYLGTTVTSEDDANQNSTATGDHTSLSIPDDGTILPLKTLKTTDTTYSFVETITNNSGLNANLYAWIDFNKDGLFQLEESAIGSPLIIPPTKAGTQDITLQFNVPIGTIITPGETFVRVRLTTDSLDNKGDITTEDTRSIGPAGDGEVEDYLLKISSPPTCPTTKNVSTTSNKEVSGNITAVDFQGEFVSYSISTLPSNGVAKINPNTGDWSYTPSLNYSGSDSFIVTATNTSGLSCTTTVNITVLAISPTCPLPQNVSTTSNKEILGNITAIDPQNKTILYSISTLPSNGVAKINPNTGDWSYTPSLNYSGSDSFIVTATNTSGLSCTTTVNITVLALSPICPLPQNVIISKNEIATGTILSIDPQGGKIIYSIEKQGENGVASIDSLTGIWAYTPNTNFYGKDIFTVRSTNEIGLFCSTVVEINILNPDVSIKKVSNVEKVQIGDSFSYSITSENIGDTPISNSIIKDNLPTNFQIQSLQLDGINIGGSLISGIDIGPLNIGQSRALFINVKVLTSPTPNPYTNIATGNYQAIINPTKPPINIFKEAYTTIPITIVDPKIALIKSANKVTTAVGETIIYSITARNDGNIPLDDVIIQDPLTPELKFVLGSVKIDNIDKIADSIISGVNIGSIGIGEYKILAFSALVISSSSQPVINIANSSFRYTVDPTKPQNYGSNKSNPYTISIKNPHLSLEKTSDIEIAILDGTITYTVAITNDGDVDAIYSVFKDTLPPNVSLIDGSFSINGKIINSVDIIHGVDIGTIYIDKTVIVKYSVKVISTNCKGNIINSAIVNFGYQTSNSSTITRIDSDPATNSILQAISLFKQFNLENYLSIPEQKPDMEQINEITGLIEISNYYTIDTPIGLSEEGQTLTGNKLIIHGILTLTLNYTADIPEQSVHSSQYCVPFSSFIVIPKEFSINCSAGIKGLVEDIYFNQTTNRCFFTNATVILIASSKQ
ncbi:MAG: DUF11 domain-containing protein [Oscillospiraceae bacterium]|nr:DUF11 domain-containing protein [Oscillospiraceae bacterium]